MKRRINVRLLAAGATLLASAAIGLMIGRIGAPPTTAQLQDWQPPTLATPAPTASPANTREEPSATATIPPRRPPTATATAVPTIAPSVTQTAVVPELTAVADAPATSTAAEVLYTVQRGDILYRVAQRFNTTPEAIIALNPDINPQSLRVGQVLRIR